MSRRIHKELAGPNCVWLVVALFIGLAHSSAQVVQSTLPPVEVWNLLEGNLSVVTRVGDLPESVRTALAKVFHQVDLRMADRDHEVRPRCPDCIVERLIFAGVSPEECFVYYSAIGFATTNRIIVFDVRARKDARPLWAASGVYAVDLQQLRSAIAEGKFHTDPILQSSGR